MCSRQRGNGTWCPGYLSSAARGVPRTESQEPPSSPKKAGAAGWAWLRRAPGQGVEDKLLPRVPAFLEQEPRELSSFYLAWADSGATKQGVASSWSPSLAHLGEQSTPGPG